MSADRPPPKNVDGKLSQRYDRLFRFGMDSDLSVICGEQSWQVHTAIICPRSTFFASACWDQSSVSIDVLSRLWNVSHPHTKLLPIRHIVLQEDEPWAVEKMLRYFYILEYFTLPDDYARFEFAAELNTDVQMYILAQKYGIAGLRDIAGERYKRSLQAYLVGCQANSLHKNVNFHPYCSDDYARREYFAELLVTLEVVYCSSPESSRLLREHTVDVIRDILCRWSRSNLYENSMYAYLGAYLKCAYQALLEESFKDPPVDFRTLAEKLSKWREEYASTQETWMKEHRSAWCEDWEE